MILTDRDFRTMPWANGKGTTVEMLKLSDAEGLVLRISRAQVVEDGDFSVLPGIQRNLTVLSGPGFTLEGPARLTCRPLAPVAFDGSRRWRAVNVAAPSEDFNVMARDSLPPPQVRLARAGDRLTGTLVLAFALQDAVVGGQTLPRGALALLTDADASLSAGEVLAVRVEAQVAQAQPQPQPQPWA